MNDGLIKIIPAILATHPGLAPFVIWGVVISFAAGVIDSALPQPAAGSHWLPVRKIVSFAALNFGRAANVGQPSISTWLVRVLASAARHVPAESLTGIAAVLIERGVVSESRPAQ